MYSDKMGRQVEASYFCIHLEPNLHQCVIFDSNKPDAHLVGIEYVISESSFRRLPEEEKHLWHSHHYDVFKKLADAALKRCPVANLCAGAEIVLKAHHRAS